MADQMEQPEQKPIMRVCKRCNICKPLIESFPLNCNKKYVNNRLHTCDTCHKIVRKQNNKKYYEDIKKRASAPSTPSVVDVSDI